MFGAFIFVPIIVVFFLALSVTNRRSLKENLTPYQSVLTFGLLNFGILCLISLAVILSLTLLYSGGDNSGSVALVFLFPIAGVATFVEMLIVFFIFRVRYSESNKYHIKKNDWVAKTIFILLVVFVFYTIISIFIRESTFSEIRESYLCGLRVQNFLPNSPAQQVGIKEGDIIKGINGVNFTQETIENGLKSLTADIPVVLNTNRGNFTVTPIYFEVTKRVITGFGYEILPNGCK